MDKILERNAPPLCSQWLSLGGGTTDDSYFLFGFSISQALYKKMCHFSSQKTSMELTFTCLHPGKFWGMVVGLGLSSGRGLRATGHLQS